MLAGLAPERLVLTEAVHGWRTWGLAGHRDGHDVRLLPTAGTRRPWPARRPVRAECGRRRNHPVPGPDCTCGIHATRLPDLLRRTREPAVLGRVALWGRVVEHVHGYRAEYAYPQRAALVCTLCFWQWGERARPPDLVVRRRGGGLTPLCEPHLALSRRYGDPARHVLGAAEVERAVLDAYAIDVLPLFGRLSGAMTRRGGSR